MGQNMSYCRFQNTLAALRECEEDFGSPENLSEEEQRARLRMLKLMKRICDDQFDDDGNLELGDKIVKKEY